MAPLASAAAAEWDDDSLDRTPAYDDPLARAARPAGAEALGTAIRRAAARAVAALAILVVVLAGLVYLS